MEGRQTVDGNFVRFALHWVVNLAFLLAAPLAKGFLTPSTGLPVLVVLLALYVAWDVRSVRPDGCILSLPFFVATLVVYALAMTAMAKRPPLPNASPRPTAPASKPKRGAAFA